MQNVIQAKQNLKEIPLVTCFYGYSKAFFKSVYFESHSNHKRYMLMHYSMDHGKVKVNQLKVTAFGFTSCKKAKKKKQLTVNCSLLTVI